MPFSISFSGGLDVQSLVAQLLQVEGAPQRALERARSALSATSGALDAFESRLKTIRADAAGIRAAGALELRQATTSDGAAVGASAAAGAQVGSYEVQVTTLASTHSFASLGYVTPDETLPWGSFDVTVGGQSVTIEVGEGSDTLESLRDAISASGAGVQALVLFDGENYLLNLTSRTGGEAGEITLDNFTSGALQSALSFSEKSQALDAAFSVNGVEFTRGSNRVTDAVEGLTLDLKQAGAAAVVTVAADLEKAIEAIRKFVDSYNTLTVQMREQLAASGKQAGPLAQLSSVRRLQDKLRSLVSRNVEGLDGDLANLRQAGVELSNDGSLKIDESKLRSAVESGAAAKLLSLSGRTTDARVVYLGTSAATDAGSYEVTVTRAAERAVVTGTETIGTLAQDETLTFTRGDLSVEVDLSAGQTLAQAVTTINDALRGTGIDAVAADDGTGKLQLRSRGYGSAATVEVRSSTDAAGSTGIGSGGLSDVGVDVEGSIDGVAASGTGRVLSAVSGDAEGLRLEVRAGAAEIDPEGTDLGDAVVSHGVAERLYRALDLELSSSGGALKAERAGIKARDRAFADRLESLDRRLAEREKLLTRQLVRADEALRRMQFLTQSLGAQLG